LNYRRRKGTYILSSLQGFVSVLTLFISYTFYGVRIKAYSRDGMGRDQLGEEGEKGE
jgi:hypothetical protein